MTKWTYVEAVRFAINALPEDAPQEVVDKLEALREQLAKRKGSGSNKPTKAQRENVGVKANIVEFLNQTCGLYSATDVATAVGISCQKASALLGQLKDEGSVERIVEGKRVYFKAVE